MLEFYRRSLIEEMWGKDGTWGKSIKNNKNNNEKKIKINHLLGDRKLQENDEISFEMIIQNKNGKVIKFDSKSYNITVLENMNSISEGEDIDNNKENSEANNINQNKFNWLITIYIVLLFI